MTACPCPAPRSWERDLSLPPWDDLLSAPSLFVYRTLRHRAHGATGPAGLHAYAPLAWISKSCHLSPSTIRRTLRDLATVGLVLTWSSFSLRVSHAQGCNLFSIANPWDPFRAEQIPDIEARISPVLPALHPGWTYALHSGHRAWAGTGAPDLPPGDAPAPSSPPATPAHSPRCHLARGGCQAGAPKIPDISSGTREKPQQPPMAIGKQAVPPIDAVLLQSLRSLGVAEPVARRLLRDHGADSVQTQLDLLPWRPQPQNPAAFIVAAVRGQYGPPATYTRDQLRRQWDDVREQERSEWARHVAACQSATPDSLSPAVQDPATPGPDALIPSTSPPESPAYALPRQDLVSAFSAGVAQEATPDLPPDVVDPRRRLSATSLCDLVEGIFARAAHAVSVPAGDPAFAAESRCDTPPGDATGDPAPLTAFAVESVDGANCAERATGGNVFGRLRRMLSGLAPAAADAVGAPFLAGGVSEPPAVDARSGEGIGFAAYGPVAPRGLPPAAPMLRPLDLTRRETTFAEAVADCGPCAVRGEADGPLVEGLGLPVGHGGGGLADGPWQAAGVHLGPHLHLGHALGRLPLGDGHDGYGVRGLQQEGAGTGEAVVAGALVYASEDRVAAQLVQEPGGGGIGALPQAGGESGSDGPGDAGGVERVGAAGFAIGAEEVEVAGGEDARAALDLGKEGAGEVEGAATGLAEAVLGLPDRETDAGGDVAGGEFGRDEAAATWSRGVRGNGGGLEGYGDQVGGRRRGLGDGRGGSLRQLVGGHTSYRRPGGTVAFTAGGGIVGRSAGRLGLAGARVLAGRWRLGGESIGRLGIDGSQALTGGEWLGGRCAGHRRLGGGYGGCLGFGRSRVVVSGGRGVPLSGEDHEAEGHHDQIALGDAAGHVETGLALGEQAGALLGLGLDGAPGLGGAEDGDADGGGVGEALGRDGLGRAVQLEDQGLLPGPWGHGEGANRRHLHAQGDRPPKCRYGTRGTRSCAGLAPAGMVVQRRPRNTCCDSAWAGALVYVNVCDN